MQINKQTFFYFYFYYYFVLGRFEGELNEKKSHVIYVPEKLEFFAIWSLQNIHKNFVNLCKILRKICVIIFVV